MARWRFWRRRPAEPEPEPWYPNVRIFDGESGELLWKHRLEPGQTSVQVPTGIILDERPYRVVTHIRMADGVETGQCEIRYSPFPALVLPGAEKGPALPGG